MKTILAAIDFSDLTKTIIDRAIEQAEQQKANLCVIHVQNSVPAFIGSEIEPQLVSEQVQEEAKRIEADLNAIRDYVIGKGIENSVEIVQGPVAESIIQKATDKNCDMIVLGVHTHGLMYRAFIGSISTAVIKQACCPVLVVPQKCCH
jgi:nucleotide-binding universal stress UspA family protein